MWKSLKSIRGPIGHFHQLRNTFANDTKPDTNPAVTIQIKSSATVDPSPLEDVKILVPKFAEVPKNVEIVSSMPNIQVASFDSIPGPISLRIISNLWQNVPLLSTELTGGVMFQVFNLGNLLSWGGNKRFFQKFFNIYGPVVRLHGPFGGDVVLLSRPEHASIVFQNEGTQPVRACLDSIEKYRLQYRKLKQAGPFLMTGPEWEMIHNTLEQPLQSSASKHFNSIDTISDQFIERILSIRNLQDEVPGNFKNEILKWALECTCWVALKRNFGFLDTSGLSQSSDPGRILESVSDAVEAIRKCEYGFHIWKFVETPAWKSLVRNCDTIDSVLTKYLERAQSNLRNKKQPTSASDLSIIESLLLKEDVLLEDVMTVMLDMLLIGSNALTHSVAFLLYDLAKNPKCQRKLYEEIKDRKLDSAVLKQLPYLQACMKESLRLNPPIPIINRILAKDAIIYKYKIPKGTYVLIAAHLASIREEYFEDAYKFNPDRWLGAEVSPLAEELQRFASMPFGYGPKSCQAQQLAEMEIGLFISKFVKKFKIEYNYGELDSSNALLATPAKPLKFSFVDRE